MKISEINLLLVENNSDDTAQVLGMLDACGIDHQRVQVKETLASACSHIESGATFDMVLLDLNLPDSQGFETLDTLRRSLLENTPIIVLTTIDVEDFGLSAVERGAEDYLDKGTITVGQLKRAFRYAVQRGKIQQSLDESVELFRLLFRDHVAIKLIIDPSDGRIIDANQAAAGFYGWSIEQLKKMSMVDINTASREEFFRLAEKICRKEKNYFELEHRLADGSLRIVEVYSSPIVLGDKEYFHSIVHDVTERKQKELDRERLKAAIEQVGESIVITDRNGTILYGNPVIEKITGYSCGELLGRNPRMFKSGHHDRQFYRDLWETLLSGKSWTGRIVNKRKDETLFTEAATISPVFNNQGEIVNFVAVKRDITEHLLLEAQLQQAQKMESVGRLAGGVAHDFNNMLGVIMGYTQMAIAKCGTESAMYEDLHEVLEAAQRSANITRQLLAFARKQVVSPQVLNLNEAVEGILKMLRRLIGEDVRLIWQPHPSLWTVRIDPNQVNQILANLCVNARDAIPGVGTITIATEKLVVDNRLCLAHRGLVPGEYVKLTVTDSGCGISKEIHEKIFEPFFTTKEVGQGTGLGLATVYGIVKQNDGYIFVESEPGEGACFTICLPRVEGEFAGGETTTTEREIFAGHGETILVVEDEGAILRLTGKILKSAGYRVLTAKTPSQALQLAEQYRAAIGLLLSDIIMPEMNGKDLAEEVRQLIPGLKCLFMSGYADTVLNEKGGVPSDTPFLRKPFSAEELTRKVHAMLIDVGKKGVLP